MRVAISTIALLACTSLASAADLGGPYEPYGGSLKDEPIAAAPFSWTGFYIGANAGYGWADADADSLPPGSPGLPNGLDPDAEPDGWFGGGQIGYNLQSGPVVFGVEVDFQGADLEDTINFDAESNGVGKVATEINSFGSVRGRIGLPLDRVMPYVTGGFAWADVDSHTDVTYPGDVTFKGGDSSTHLGWVGGAGVEIALSPNWSAKAEYLYYDLGEKTYTTTLVGPGPGDTYTADADLTLQTFRIGVNYRFGGMY